MKKFKLLLAAFVATLFAFAGVKASAYTITINGTTSGHTYEAYQVFSGTLAESDNQTLSDIDWGSDVNTFEFDGESDAAKIAEKLAKQATDSETAKAFAKAANANLKEGSKPASATSEGKTVTITLSKPGYYLVKDKDGSQNSENGTYTRFMMQVVGNATANVKNGVPSVQKKVKENSNSKWQDAADYDFDDDVPFQLTATLPSNFDDYSEYYLEFSDTLSAGLTYNKDAKVFLVNGENKTDIASSFTIAEDGSSFKINNLKSIPGVTSSSKIVVEYTAKLNKNAVIGSEGNPNTVKLVYSNNPNYEGKGEESPKGNTPEDTVKVFTYQTIINKLDENKKALAGAGFTLYKDGKEFKKLPAGEATTFEFKGLDAGNYKLEESTTPDGYNTIKPIEFTINAKYDPEADDPQLTELSGDVTSGVAKFDANKADGSLKADIVNRKGSLLPSTGGMGTTILYVIGSILVLVAAVLLITKKRMDAAK
ncbi:isopeptide-forming domain-containing fimbrial protein [Streptococcus equinus]|uniref:isopeptide-forming domain-containing fimbrial protein n=1 Tax=Streptococcus equinus TaxID=1335 RepID=UPI003BF8777F